MIQVLLFPLLTACSDYSFDEGKTYVTEPDDTAVEEEYIPTEDPDLLVEPSTIDFGYLMKDCPSDPIDVTITNRGIGDAEITDIFVDGNGASAFSTTYDGSTITLAQDESITIGMYFLPTLYLDYQVELEIDSNDPEPPETNVLGVGSSGTMFEESFTQDYNSAVDVLWVFDNSCSMQDQIEGVSNKFSSFLSSFLSLGLDYQMAIVTTDSATFLQDSNGQSIMNTSQQSQQQVETIFTDIVSTLAVEVGNSPGSADEKGLEFSKAALSANPNFIRNPDNGLSVIVVTDEDDFSSISGANYISWFQGLKPNDFTLSRFHGFLDNSGGIFGGASKYEEVIQNTQGYQADVTSTDYGSALESIALASAGLTTRFPLQQVPENLTSISVVINGNNVPQDIFEGWSYDSRTNSISFNGSSIPDVGETVYITYSVASECN